MSNAITGYDLPPMSPLLPQLLEAAHRVGERAAAEAEETDKRRCVSRELVDDMVKGGLIDILQPKRYGGKELGFREYMRVGLTIGEYDISAAWVWGILSIHHYWGALVDPRLQDELWKDDHHRIFSDVFAPVGKVEVDGDNYIVSGKWSFASGSPFGTFCSVGAMAPWEPGSDPEYLMMFVAPGDYEILDDWDTVGLRGSASCSIQVDRAVVPKYRAMRLGRFVATGQAPGHAYNNGGIYHVPFGIALTGALLAPGMGGANGVLKAFRERMRERTPLFAAQNQAGQAGAQLLLAELTARTNAAEQLYLHYADEADALALRIERGEPTGDLLEMRARMFGWRAHIARECRAVGNEVFQHAGAFAIYEGSPIQRFWRDLYAMGQHIAVNHETGMLAFGRSLVGLEPEAVLF